MSHKAPALLSIVVFCASCLLPEVAATPSPESTSSGTSEEPAQSANAPAADGGSMESLAATSSPAEAAVPDDGMQASADASAEQGQPCPTAGQLVCDGTCRELSTDALNCGQCGHSCGNAECAMGECQGVMLAQEPNPVSTNTQLAQDAERLYWTSLNGVASVAKSGGPIKMIANRKQSGGGIVADASWVYWGDNSSGAISKVPSNGGNIVNIAIDVKCNYMAVDATYLYISTPDKGMRKLPLAGGSSQPVGSEQGSTSAIVLDAQFLYWLYDEGVMRAPISGGSASQLAITTFPFGLALANNELFWTAGSSLMRLPISGGQPSLLVSFTYTSTIAADSSHVYVLGGDLTKVSTSDGAREVLLKGALNNGPMVLDQTSVYWMSDGRVMKFPK